MNDLGKPTFDCLFEEGGHSLPATKKTKKKAAKDDDDDEGATSRTMCFKDKSLLSQEELKIFEDYMWFCQAQKKILLTFFSRRVRKSFL
jgi:hypothetical protein